MALVNNNLSHDGGVNSSSAQNASRLDFGSGNVHHPRVSGSREAPHPIQVVFFREIYLFPLLPRQYSNLIFGIY